MRICFASDLHGHESHYAELIGLVKSNRTEVLLLGGDLLPRKGHHQASLEIQQRYVMKEFLSFARKVKEECGAALCVILGNDDWAGTLPLFSSIQAEGLLTLLSGSPLMLDERTIVFGYSFVPPTPFLLKDFEKRDQMSDASPSGLRRIYMTKNGRVEETDETDFFSSRPSMQEDLEGWPMFEYPPRTICVMHSPPYGTVLDRLYDGRSAGSRAVRDFISKTRPSVTLHGHIHESPEISGSYVEKIKDTLSVNPGQSGKRISAVFFQSETPNETLVHSIHGKYSV
jgi:Icc-related predicted phosphoesterase